MMALPDTVADVITFADSVVSFSMVGAHSCSKLFLYMLIANS